jgi:hypothetical protein
MTFEDNVKSPTAAPAQLSAASPTSRPTLTLGEFLATIAVLLVCLAAVNAAVVRLTRHSLPKQVLARAAASGSYRTLALGNSLIAAGFDAAAFDRGMGTAPTGGAVNLGLGATAPVEHLLLLRAALRGNVHAETVVYGFYDLQLTQPVRLRTSELFGNHAMLYYDEPKFGEKYFQQSPHDRVEFAVMRQFPMIVERGAIWAKVERFRRTLAEQGMGKQATNRFGNVGDFSLLEAPEIAQFSDDCILASRQELNSAVQEMIREATERGIKTVVVVEMPIHPYHVNTFYRLPAWKTYTGHLREQLGAQHVAFVDASEWIRAEGKFEDHLHLSPEGAAEFSERLGAQLQAQLGGQ